MATMTATRLHYGALVGMPNGLPHRVIERVCAVLHEPGTATDQKVWGSNPYGRAM